MNDEQKIIERLLALLGRPDPNDPGRFARLLKRYLPKLSDGSRHLLHEAILLPTDQVIGITPGALAA